jgi:hypothetical protein
LKPASKIFSLNEGIYLDTVLPCQNKPDYALRS